VPNISTSWISDGTCIYCVQYLHILGIWYHLYKPCQILLHPGFNLTGSHCIQDSRRCTTTFNIASAPLWYRRRSNYTGTPGSFVLRNKWTHCWLM
jgi:hypothetical protein